MKFKLLIGILLLISIVVSACNSNNSRGYTGGNPAGYNPQPSGVYNPPPAKKCETVFVDYQEYEPEEYKVVGEAIIKGKTTGINYYKEASLTVQNLEQPQGMYGTFQGKITVFFYFTTAKRGTEKLSVVHDILPQQTQEFIANYDVDIGEDVDVKYEVIPGKKLVTKKREETKCY